MTGTGRTGYDLFFWLKNHGIKKTFRTKIWKERYFWQDTLFTKWNRFIGCKVLGHRYKGSVEDGKGGWKLFCFNCYQKIGAFYDKDKHLHSYKVIKNH